MTNTTNLEHFHDCMNALERKIQRENFRRRACFPEPEDACKWARINAHDAFTAHIADGHTVLVLPLSDTPWAWMWTEHICPFAH